MWLHLSNCMIYGKVMMLYVFCTLTINRKMCRWMTLEVKNLRQLHQIMSHQVGRCLWVDGGLTEIFFLNLFS